MSDQQQEHDPDSPVDDDPRKLRRSDQLPEEQPEEVADDEHTRDEDDED